MIGLAVKAIVAISSFGLLLQSPAVTPTGPLDGVGRLSLDGCLIVAVVTLWRALAAQRNEQTITLKEKDVRIAEKDAQVVAMATKVTEVMTLVMESVRELRVSINELRDENGLKNRVR